MMIGRRAAAAVLRCCSKGPGRGMMGRSGAAWCCNGGGPTSGSCCLLEKVVSMARTACSALAWMWFMYACTTCSPSKSKIQTTRRAV